MRGATLRDLNIRWFYWLIPSVFGVAAIVALLAIKSEKEDRFTLIACALFFGAFSLLGFLWPVLRLREKHGVRFCSLRYAGESVQGMFIPASSVKVYVLLIGGGVFAITGLACAIAADSLGDRIKGAAAFLFYTGFAVLWLRGLRARKPGILLSEQGILWHEALLDPCFVPWEQISVARVYEHREKYSTPPTFGVRMRNLAHLSAGRRTKARLVENFNRHGWHLYYHAESLLAPLDTVEAAVDYYQQHGAARNELATGIAINRISNGVS